MAADSDPTGAREQWLLAEAEVARLTAWKAEAMVVLAEWDKVWFAAGCPGPLGSSKAASVRRFIDDLLDAEDETDRLVALADRLERPEPLICVLCHQPVGFYEAWVPHGGGYAHHTCVTT